MSESYVPRGEDTETTQQHCPQQDCRLVIGALLLGFGLALAAAAVARKWCPRC
jgi:hypothetical protein